MIGLVMEHEGAAVGNVVLFMEGTGNACMEIGWTVFPRAGGKGLSTEATRVALGLVFEHHGVRRVVANLDAASERSEWAQQG